MTHTQPEHESEPFEGDGPKQYYHRAVITRVIVAVTVLLLVIFITLSQIFAWGRVSVLNGEVARLRQQTDERAAKADCLALYRNDVTTALGVALAASNSLWVSVAVRDPNLTDEERAADNIRLGKALEESNAPLVAASEALIQYDALDPKPEVCPHPGE